MKKIIASMLLACMMCSPMMVSAYEDEVEINGVTKKCEILENYYFLLEEPSSYGTVNSDGYLDDSTEYYAYYDDTTYTIKDTDIIDVMRDIRNLEYHEKLFDALRDYKNSGYNDVEYVDEEELDEGKDYYTDRYGDKHYVKWYLQSSFKGVGDNNSDQLPFLANTYLQDTSNSFKNNVEKSYVYLKKDATFDSDPNYCHECSINVVHSKTSNGIRLKVNKSYQIPVARQNDSSIVFYNTPDNDTIPGPWYTVNNSYSIAWIPALYKIEHYDPNDCVAISDDDETSYTITYNPNGGTGDVKMVDVNDGDSHNVLDNNEVTKYTREGYTFIGWNTNKDATQEQYVPGSSLTPKSNMTLYAIWQNNGGGKEAEDQSRNGLGYSIGIISAILIATGAGVVYFKKRNKFENI